MNSNIIGILDGKIHLESAKDGTTRSLTAYVCRPDRSVVCRLLGIQRFEPSMRYNDISQISFEVTRYITDPNTFETIENPSYDKLTSFMGILVPELGQFGYFRINKEPSVQADNTRQEKKTFTADSYESVLSYESLFDFRVNYGQEENGESSLECYDDNVDAFGNPKNKIVFYNPDEPRLSLLNLVLENDTYGWQIGTVDRALYTMNRAFDIDNQNILSFLRTDCSKEFRCIFQFDTINKKINVTSVENAGKNTNIYFSFDNFVKQINVSPQTDEIYTVFNVAGGSDLDITGVNFGSRYLINIDYPLSLIGGDLEAKYHEYETFRESKRDEYVKLFTQAEDLYNKVSAIEDTRKTSDLVNEKFSSELDYPTVDDLEKVRTTANTIISTIEELYTTNGVFDIDALNESDDAGIYHSLKEVVIPDVQTEIRNRNNDVTTTKDQLVDDSTIWEMYGLYDLLDKQESLRQIIKTYAQAGYAEDSAPETSLTTATWQAHHDEYLKKKKQFDELSELITKKQTRIKELQSQIKDLEGQMAKIGDSVKLETYFADNPDYVSSIKEMYKISDYTNNNFIITDSDDGVSILAEQKNLLEDAKKRLEIESHPQFKWEIDSANLYAMPEFKDYRDNIQDGDFIIIGYHNAVCAPKEYNKLRITEIDFDGLDIEKTFKLTFSNMIVTQQDTNDFESLIGDYIQSSVNSISIAATASSRKAAADATASMIKPYLQVQQLDAENANITNATIDDLKAQRGEFDTILANYATIDLANVKDGSIKNAMIDKGAVNTAQIADGSITDAKIIGLSADKLTAGTIDASNIDVTNLNADNITVGKINGKQIANGAIGSDNLSDELNSDINLAKKSIRGVQVQYALGDSIDNAPTTGWQTNAPKWQEGSYIWQKTVTTLADGTEESSEAVCITGVKGADATTYDLQPNVDAVVKASDGTLNPATITATAKSKTGTNDATDYIGRYNLEESIDGQTWTSVYTSSGNEASMPAYTIDGTAKQYRITLYEAGGTETVLDQQTIPVVEDGTSGEAAYTVFLNNESHTFAGTESEAIPTSITIRAIAYKGGTKVTPTVSSASGTGITATPGTAVDNEVPITISITSELANSGSLTIPITIDDKSFDHTFSYAIAFKGRQGQGGGDTGIEDINDQYYLSTSDSTQEGGEWLTTCPKWEKGHYIWTRSQITWTDGKITTTTPVLAAAINSANETAASAQETADGKNTVYYGTVAPTGGTYKENDLWFNTAQDNAQYRWNGTEWQKQEFGTDALGNISANKITTGTLDASKVAVDNLSANSITGGTIDAQNVTIQNIDAGNISTGILDANRIGAETITSDKLVVGSGHNIYDLGYDDFEQISDDMYLNGHKIVDQQIYEQKGATSAAIDDHEAYVGTRCLKVTNDSRTTDGYVNLGCEENNDGAIPVVHGKTYIFSAWMKSNGNADADLSLLGASDTFIASEDDVYFSTENDALISAEVNVTFTVVATATEKELPDDNYLVSGEEDDELLNTETGRKSAAETNATIGTEWMRVWGRYTIPDDVDRIAVQVKNKTESSTLWVDAIQIESGTNKQSPSEWHSAGATIINGGQITTGSVTARQIAAKSITANQILANTITSAEIAAGAIKAVNIASDTITGNKIAGHTITGTNIAAKSITADNIQTNTITSLGAVTAGSFNLGNGKFQVTNDGVLTATSGKIGGYTIDDYTLKGNQVGMSSQSGHDWAFWAGSNTSGSAPFRVGHDGSVYATNMNITGGSINVGNGNFVVNSSGTLTAKNGTFSGSITGGSININNNFKVSSTGALTAKGADISGTITADHIYARDGNIGNYTIVNSGLSSGFGGGIGEISGGRIKGTTISGSLFQTAGTTVQGTRGYYTMSYLGFSFIGSSVQTFDPGDGSFLNHTEHSIIEWDGENWEIDGGTIYTSNNFTGVDHATSADYAGAVRGGLGNVHFQWTRDGNGAYHIQAQGWNGNWHTITGDQGTNWS